jgi:DNA primase
MNKHINRLDEAIRYHESLPSRIRQYLKGRGIPDDTINSFLIGWNGWRITIPIYDRDGKVVFFKMAKDPEDTGPGPKMFAPLGGAVELYGWEQLVQRPSRIVVCEGEFDRLVLEARGFAAVTSTGGAATFRPQWAEELRSIDEVYVCFDRDQAGRNGAAVVGLMVPNAKVVELPDEVGEGGDVTDFFVRLGRSSEEFTQLLETGTPASAVPQETRPDRPPQMQSTDALLNRRIERITRALPIEKVIEEYLTLRASGESTLVGLCPFHEDRTPSLTVYPATGTFHCFGCRATGDVISFVRAIEHLGFAQTLDALDQMASHNESKPQQDTSEDKAA